MMIIIAMIVIVVILMIITITIILMILLLLLLIMIIIVIMITIRGSRRRRRREPRRDRAFALRGAALGNSISRVRHMLPYQTSSFRQVVPPPKPNFDAYPQGATLFYPPRRNRGRLSVLWPADLGRRHADLGRRHADLGRRPVARLPVNSRRRKL